MGFLVTGGAGFLGSHLVDALLARKDWVTVLDDLSTGSLDNLAKYKESDRLEVVIGSVTDGALVDQLMARSKFAFHLASVVGVRRVLERPVDTVLTSTFGTATVLGAASDHGVPCLLTSSSEVYGRAGEDGHLLSEESDLLLGSPGRSRWSYAIGKLAEESLAAGFHSERGLFVLVVRPFNMIGQRQTSRYGMVVPRFVEQALRNQPLQIYGDGKQTRSFTRVADAVRLLLALADRVDREFRIVNLGSQGYVSIIDLANLVIELTRSRSSIVFVDSSDLGPGFEDVYCRSPDLTYLRSLIDDVPRTDLRSAILEIIEHAGCGSSAGLGACDLSDR